MSPFRRFLLRAVGLLLVGILIATVVGYQFWGIGAVPLVAWSAASALLLGIVGFRSMLKGLRMPMSGVAGVQVTLLVGLIVRLLLLCVSQIAVFAIYGREWGSRALLATVSFYMIVLGAEVFTLARELGIFAPRASKPETKREEGTPQ